jgi:pyruvate dehydrogenase E2 component (dihydrolipoamide acetyltransferase)
MPMITKVIMPKLGETMEEGIITRWFKREGEKVVKGESLLEVTTDKATFEVEAPADGILRKIIFPADNDRKIPVTQTLAYITDTAEEEIPEIKEAVLEETRPTPKISEKEVSESLPKTAEPILEKKIKASPLAKKLAKEKGVALSQIKGTGPGGRITEKDVLKFIETLQPEEEIKITPLSDIRKTIAHHVSQSKHDVPHYYLQMEIEMTRAVKIRQASKKRFSYNDLIIKAVAKALEEFPLLNSTFEEEKIKTYKKINIGFLLSQGEKLLIPVIKEANKKSLDEISNKTQEIKEKAKLNKFQEEDFSEGTFTISNLGMYDIDVFTAIINSPQVAILAVGKIKEALQVKEEKIAIGYSVKVCLSLDHRVIDGVYGAQFLARVKEILENPTSIL